MPTVRELQAAIRSEQGRVAAALRAWPPDTPVLWRLRAQARLDKLGALAAQLHPLDPDTVIDADAGVGD